MIRIIFTYLTLVLYIGAMYYLSGGIGVAYYLGSVFVYFFIFYAIYLLVKKIRIQGAIPAREFLDLFLYRIHLIIFIVVAILGVFSVYQNEISPAKTPQYTLQNGKKTVVFQTMSHIATEDFYDQVQAMITGKKAEGYVLFYEGVRPGSKESSEAFNRAIGFSFDADTYKYMSQLYGAVHQNNDDFLGIGTTPDYNVDLDMDQIMQYYADAQVAYNISDSGSTDMLPVDISKDVMEALSSVNERQLQVLVYINRAVLNAIIKNDSVRSFIADNIGNERLFDVILNQRNDVVARQIQGSEDSQIIVLYGLLHFEGILKLLSSFDQNWQITKTVDLYPLKD